MIEWIGVVTGILYVWLAARQSILCWPTSLLNLAVYFYVFWIAGLYADAGLQIFYLVLTLYGWWQWRKGKESAELPVRSLTRRERIWAVASVLGLNALLFLLLRSWTDSNVPILDAHTTAVSLVAQALTTRKILQSWVFWIWANLFYCGLYLQKGLYPTFGLYALFIVLAVYGYRKWKTSIRV